MRIRIPVSGRIRPIRTEGEGTRLGTPVISAAIQVIAFDCDGVLFDSSAANEAYYNYILGHFGLPVMTAISRSMSICIRFMIHCHYLFNDSRQALAAETFRREIQPLPFIRLMTIEPRFAAFIGRASGKI